MSPPTPLNDLICGRAGPRCADRTGPGTGRRHLGADRLYVRHHGRAQGCDDDASGDDVAVLLRHPQHGFFRVRPSAGRAAAVSHGADPCLHHAAASGRRPHHPDRGTGAGACPAADRAGTHHLVLRAADGVDQPAAASGFRHTRPVVTGEGLLRRLDHAGSGAARTARAAAARPSLQLLWPDRDRAARHRAAAGGTRRAPGLLRASRA